MPVERFSGTTLTICRYHRTPSARQAPAAQREKSQLRVLRLAWSRLPFLIAVALIAAALGDPLVETIANTGLFGHGYADNNHLSVVPTLIAGALLAFALIWRRCLELLHRPVEHRDWLVEIATRISARSPLQDLPYVLILQFGALYVMESSEQILSGGSLLSGTAWFGGPIWFSVLTHVLLGTACTVLVARAMRSIVKRCATLIRIALEFLLDAFSRQGTGAFARHGHNARPFRLQNVHVHQLGERAPPLLATLI
jgi:hypothetical protein